MVFKIVYLMKLIMRRSQFKKYMEMLRFALGQGYQLVSLDEWCAERKYYEGKRTIILRHDIDQMPSAALIMAKLENSLGIRSTFYFRWSTADKKVIDKIKKLGGNVGFHYETISRYAIAHNLNKPEDITKDVIDHCKSILKGEITLFKNIFGDINSIAHHGDPIWKKISFKNSALIEGENPEEFGIRYIISDEFLKKYVDAWISESTELSLNEAIENGYAVILFNSHPQCWAKGISYFAHKLTAIGYGYCQNKKLNLVNLCPFHRIPNCQQIWGEII